MTNNLSSNRLTMKAFSTVHSSLIFFISISYCTTVFGQGSLQRSKNIEVVQKWFDMFNKHDISEINKVFATDYIWHTMEGKDIHSAQDSSHITSLRYLLRAVPDVQYTIESIVNDGDVVAVNTIVTGTAQTEYFGLPAGQKTFRVKQMFFYRLEGGRIKEEWEVIDGDLMMKQLGRNCSN